MSYLVSAWRELQVVGTMGKGRSRRTWNKSVKVDMKRFGLVKDDAYNQDKWKCLATGNRSTLPQRGNEDVVLYRNAFS